MTCPLCDGQALRPFHQERGRNYLRCSTCALVFLHPDQRLDETAERAEYELHQNNPNDTGYRRFLGRMATPLLDRLLPHSKGLDFGCGPGPTLSLLFEEKGHDVALYDPFFYPNATVLNEPFDFITATEVVEHLFDPGRVLSDLYARLKPGGLLGIMTKRVRDADAFAKWHYKNDPTHVCFFHLDTFAWLGKFLGAPYEIIGPDVVIFQRSAS